MRDAPAAGLIERNREERRASVPIYDYVCGECGHRTEVIHGVHAHGPRFCPSCGAEGTMKKAFVPPTIHYKGSGWAKKDRSATSAPAKRSGASSAAGAPSSSSAETSGAAGSGDGAAKPSGGTDASSSAAD
jgi:putative FmdB family regulatory protein